MGDSIKCPKCGSELNPQARFCDQCGASLAADVPDGESARPAGGFNWVGLIVVIVVIGAIGWLFFGPKGGDQQAAADMTSTANPHGGMTSMANPHGDSSMENPHGGTSMGNPHGGTAEGGMDGSMEGLMQSLESAKAALEEDPLDVESLQVLYQSYGMIGRSHQLRERLETALTELGTRLEAGGDSDELAEAGKGVAIAAVLGGDPEGAVMVLDGMRRIWPEDRDLVAMTGDIYSSADMFDEGIAAYDEYLGGGDSDAETYLSVRIKRANAFAQRFELAGEAGDPADIDSAVSELQALTLEVADNYQAWYSLGRALMLSGDKDKAISSWRRAQECTDDGMERWAAESEIAQAEGREAPERPGMGMGMGG